MTPLSGTSEQQRQVLLERLARLAYRRGQFTLASGRQSEHYVNCKPVSLSGSGLALISAGMLAHVEESAVAGGGVDPRRRSPGQRSGDAGGAARAKPGCADCAETGQGHGTGAWLEGPLPEPGSVITVLEDVVTTGGSSLKAVHQLRDAGYRVQRVITIVDREEGGADAMAAADLDLVSLFRLSEISACSLELGE